MAVYREGCMKVLEIIIRICAGIVLLISVVVLVLLAMIRSQRDVLPQIQGYYIDLMEGSDMVPAAPEGSLILLKAENPFRPGDIVAYLNDRNDASISRILSIDGRTEDVSVEVPFEELENTLGNPGISTESVMDENPDLVMKGDNGTEEITVPADRLMAKAVFISAVLGLIISMYQNTVWAFLIIAASAVICIWPFRHLNREPKYKEQDIDGPWMG